MALFRLLAGQHIQADPDWEPSDQELTNARRTGIPPVAPSRTYQAGDMVESNTDLVEKLGPQKFERVGYPGQPGKVRAPKPQEPPPEIPRAAPLPPDQPQPRRVETGNAPTGQGQVASLAPPTQEEIDQDRKQWEEARAAGGGAAPRRTDKGWEPGTTDPSSGGLPATTPPRPGVEGYDEMGRADHTQSAQVQSEQGVRSQVPPGKAQGQAPGKDQGQDQGRQPRGDAPQEGKDEGQTMTEQYHAELDGMTMDELKAHAAECSIDIRGLRSKEEIKGRIKERSGPMAG